MKIRLQFGRSFVENGQSIGTGLEHRVEKSRCLDTFLSSTLPPSGLYAVWICCTYYGEYIYMVWKGLGWVWRTMEREKRSDLLGGRETWSFRSLTLLWIPLFAVYWQNLLTNIILTMIQDDWHLFSDYKSDLGLQSYREDMREAALSGAGHAGPEHLLWDAMSILHGSLQISDIWLV